MKSVPDYHDFPYKGRKNPCHSNVLNGLQEEVRGRFSQEVTVVIPQGMGVAVLKVKAVIKSVLKCLTYSGQPVMPYCDVCDVLCSVGF